MASCARVGTCPLFPLFTIQASLMVWRARYCDGRFADCERYKLSLGGGTVPPNLLPNGKLLGGAVTAAGVKAVGGP
jgi:hypothetical protein